jgi:hypothetical protein
VNIILLVQKLECGHMHRHTHEHGLAATISKLGSLNIKDRKNEDLFCRTRGFRSCRWQWKILSSGIWRLVAQCKSAITFGVQMVSILRIVE